MDIFRTVISFFLICHAYYIGLSECEIHYLSNCHDDFSLNPPDGILTEHTFPWLGFAHYLHVTTGLPHQSKAPRVVLIHKQFAAGTATDLLKLPNNYKLGNIVFGEYERDEEDCGLTLSQTKMGVSCPRAYIEIPYIDVTPHPEYSRFGVGNSLALIKLLRPLKSEYMVPICLPTLSDRDKQRKAKVFMVDYISSVPRNFDSERMGKKTLKLYTHRDCRRHRMRTGLGKEGVTHVLCSSGCGVRPGAPIVNHAADGPFQLIGIAAGGAPCSQSAMRKTFNTEPPFYIDVYPYVGWIVNVITAHVMPRPYPEKFMMVEGGSSMGLHTSFLRAKKKQKSQWRGRTYLVGNYCFKSKRMQKSRTSLFYSERFEVNANPPAKLNIVVEVSAGLKCTIVCARILMPNRIVTPEVKGVGRYNITVTFNTERLPYKFYFWLGLNGKNTTDTNYNTWKAELNRK